MKIEVFDINDDEVENPSINYKDLISFQKEIRHNLKSAQFHVSKVLTLKYQKLQKKLNKTKIDEDNGKMKLKNKQDEIDFLKKADLYNLAKRIFANKYSEEDLDKLGDKMSMEDRVVVRCFNYNFVKNKILKFRTEHSDWEKLAEDLLYKNSNSRIKVWKPQKVGSLPLANGAIFDKLKTKSNLKESVLLIPALEMEKKDEEYKKRSMQKEAKQKIKIENIEEEKFNNKDMSEEALNDFIKNTVDINEWEREIVEDEEEEIDLITQVDGSERAKRRKKRSEKKVHGDSRRIPGHKWKKQSNQFENKKYKESV